MPWWHWKPSSFQSPCCCKWGFSCGMTNLSWVVLTCLMFYGECLVFILALWGAGKRLQNPSFIESVFLMQQCVFEFNRHVQWEVFLQFGKKSWKKRGVEDFLSSIRISPNICMVYWDTFLLNSHSRGQQVEDHVSQWENLLWDTPSKGFERVWLYVQVPASASCTLPG